MSSGLTVPCLESRKIEVAKGFRKGVGGIELVDVKEVVQGWGDDNRLDNNKVRDVIPMQGWLGI